MARLQFDHVWKRYPDGTEAVKDLTLDIADGEFLVLVGPSGCGKSSALRMVAGLEEISEGKMIIGEQVVNHLTPKERDIAMVFQSYALYPHMTVAENMGFALKLSKVPKDEIRRRVREAADILDLTEHLDRKPRALSGGQRQRVAMGRAIVRKPQAFLMDEPLSNLDAKLRVQMRAEISQLQARLDVTTLYVTHDQVEAMTMGDRVAVLKRGVLQQVDRPQHLYDNPGNVFVAGFIGSPAMNISMGSVERGEDGALTVEVEPGTALGVPEAALERYPRVREYAGRDVIVGMRPEHFYRPDGSTPDSERWTGREVVLVEQLGAEMLIHFETKTVPVVSDEIREAVDNREAFAELERRAEAGAQPFTARQEPGDPPKIGSTVDLAFRTEYLHFFDADSSEALR
jgi:multiple sugar transport system ATP-binding protein